MVNLGYYCARLLAALKKFGLVHKNSTDIHLYPSILHISLQTSFIEHKG